MSDANLLYQPITFHVSNVAAGQRIVLQLTSHGVPIGFSAGPFGSLGGFSVTPESGSLSLSGFQMCSVQIAFLTSSNDGGSGAQSFRVEAYLVAGPRVEVFYLRSQSDSGVQVMAGIGDAEPQLVQQTQTLFGWKPVC